MAGNSDPIFSRVGDIGQSMLLTTAAADYTGVSPYNREIFAADATNGGYVQRIRFKSRGTNVATVARVYINNGGQNTNFTTAPAAPTGTPVTTGGTVMVGAHYGLVIAIGPGGSQSVVGAASTVVTTTTATSVINWSWTAVPGAVSYRIYVTIAGSPTGTFGNYFTSVTNSYSQTQASELGTPDDPYTGAQFLYDEVIQ